MLKKLIILLLIVLVIIQLFRPEKNVSVSKQPYALKKQYAIPEKTEMVLQKACYDCHSNNTHYPWYAEIQPAAWFLEHHVKEGKTELNFDEFLRYPAKKQDHKLEEIIETQEKAEMPLSSYTVIHTRAKLSPEERQELTEWAAGLRKKINYQNPE